MLTKLINFLTDYLNGNQEVEVIRTPEEVPGSLFPEKNLERLTLDDGRLQTDEEYINHLKDKIRRLDAERIKAWGIAKRRHQEWSDIYYREQNRRARFERFARELKVYCLFGNEE